jgi:hypothetical protein
VVFGLSLSTYTILHVIISLIAIGTGLIAVTGMLQSRRMAGWTAVFLWMTVLTSATGFGFPFDKLLPSHIVGILSLMFLAVALLAVYVKHLAGAWRWVYVVCAIIALWFNVFVMFVQAFQKIGFLHALAPTQSELPFQATQGLALVLFMVLAIGAVRKFRPIEA